MRDMKLDREPEHWEPNQPFPQGRRHWRDLSSRCYPVWFSVASGMPASHLEEEFSNWREAWAWEFLRRNEEYADDWRRFVDSCPDAAEGEVHIWLVDYLRDHDPAFAMRAACFADRPLAPVQDEACKWGVECLVDPRAEYLPEFLAGRTTSFAYMAHLLPILGEVDSEDSPPPEKGNELREERWALAFLDPGECLLRFDVSRPLRPQLERAGFMLAGLQNQAVAEGVIQEVAPRSRMQNLKLLSCYLRLLDAEYSGESPSSLAGGRGRKPGAWDFDPANPERPLPSESTLRTRLKAARELTQPRGYLSLLS
jgi:hypothetical protein